jgi:hypothetical protein
MQTENKKNDKSNTYNQIMKKNNNVLKTDRQKTKK